MGQLTLVVEFEIMSGKEAEFEAAIRSHASSCLAEEPGCLRFEVNYPLDEDGNRISNRMMANELFADKQSLLDHRATARWVRLSERFKTLLADRRLLLAELDD